MEEEHGRDRSPAALAGEAAHRAAAHLERLGRPGRVVSPGGYAVGVDRPPDGPAC